MNWSEAKDFCQVQGAMLAEIKTAEQMKDISDKIDSDDLTKNFWLGIIYDTTQSNWVYASSNQTVGFANWFPGNQTYTAEPNNPGQENCVEISYFFGGTWNDAQCGRNNWANNRVALCQKQLGAADGDNYASK